MADVVGQFWKATQTEAARERRRVRREARLDSMEGLGHALRGELQWSIKDQGENDSGIPLTHGQHPGTAGLMAVGDALSALDIPAGFTVRFKGMSRTSGRGAHGMSDGIITVSATARSETGINVHFDIPMIVKNSRLLEPSVIIHDGTIRVLAQSTLDELLGRVTFTCPLPTRNSLFSPPPAREEEAQLQQRPWQTMTRGTKYDVTPKRVGERMRAKRNDIQAALRGYHAQQRAHDQPTRIEPGRIENTHLYEDQPTERFDTARPPLVGPSGLEVPELATAEPLTCTQCKTQFEGPYGRENAACPQCGSRHTSSVQRSAAPTRHMPRQPGRSTYSVVAASTQEAETHEGIEAGSSKRITRELEVRDRGGCTYTLDKGTRVTVVRKMEHSTGGSNRYVVEDADDRQFVVPEDCLGKKAQLVEADDL